MHILDVILKMDFARNTRNRPHAVLVRQKEDIMNLDCWKQSHAGQELVGRFDVLSEAGQSKRCKSTAAVRCFVYVHKR